MNISMQTRANAMRARVVVRALEKGIQIPVWVPVRLIAEYADCALAHGEEQAASHIRRRKREIVNG